MTIRIRAALVALIAAASPALAQYGETPVLELTAADAARLGIEFERPETVEDLALASAPAVVKVPPSREAIVSAPLGGRITRLLVAEGSTVEAGQALVEMQSSELLGLQREYLEALNERRLTEAQLVRDQDLFAAGIIAERRLDEAKARARAARVRASQARQSLLLADMDGDALEALGASQDIEPTVTLESPFAGTVTRLDAALGEQMHPLDPVALVADLAQLWLEIHVPQELADTVSLGMRIKVEPRGEALNAEVIHVGRVVASDTQTVLVRGAIDNTRGLLRSGQVLVAKIMAARASHRALAVRSASLVRLSGRTHVFARRTNGFELLAVTVLGTDEERAYLAPAAGIDARTEIAFKGVSGLKSLLMARDEG
jgi:cobalt-zinc-cadmium efflux system membrane fusion protein